MILPPLDDLYMTVPLRPSRLWTRGKREDVIIGSHQLERILQYRTRFGVPDVGCVLGDGAVAGELA